MNKSAQQQIDAIAEACRRIKPLVVIQCITYNHEAYIRDALKGFVMQKTDFPFVAIVHDDASFNVCDFNVVKCVAVASEIEIDMASGGSFAMSFKPM